MDDPWDDFIKLHGWPECGDGRLQVEDLYQMFKERFIREQREEGLSNPTDAPK